MNHNRKSHRLKKYDYSQTGAYFITVVSQDRVARFGKIVDGEMVLNDAGKMVHNVWNLTMNEYSHINSGEFIIMPNHFHGIIQIVGADSISAHRDYNNAVVPSSRTEMDSAPTVPMIIQSFKRHMTIRYINGVKMGLVPPFRKRLWQRDYWDHIIRDESEYNKISTYIINNPQSWELDRYHTTKL